MYELFTIIKSYVSIESGGRKKMDKNIFHVLLRIKTIASYNGTIVRDE